MRIFPKHPLASPTHWSIEMEHTRSDSPIPVDAVAYVGLLTACDSAPLICHIVAFDRDTFSSEAYRLHGVAFPERVRRGVRKRQAEFFFGRLAARLALTHANRCNGYVPPEIGIGTSREPLWPQGYVGSISHSASYAAAAVSEPPRHGVGIDVEDVLDADGAAQLPGIVLDAAELDLIRSLAGSYDETVLLTLAFSAKESLFKGVFRAVGHHFDFSAARLIGVDDAGCRMRFRFAETLCPEFPLNHEVEVGFALIQPRIVMTHFVW